MTIELLAEYRTLFLATFLFFLFLIFVMMVIMLVSKVKEIYEDNKKDLTKEELSVLDYDKLFEEEKAGVIRRMIAPDAINPGPDDYMIIYDADKKIYARNLTVSMMSKRVNFATTFTELLNYKNSTSSIFIEPIEEQSMSKTLDRHLTVLDAEFIAASEKGDGNRKRKIRTQYEETNGWAAEVETGKNKFFRCGFLFTLYADSLSELTKRSDEFRSLAKNRGLDVSCNVFCQSEAYLANAPMNRYSDASKSQVNATDGVFYHYMDKYAMSCVYNYTSNTFSHKNGVPIGRNRVTHKPVIFDPYAPQFIFGMTHLVVGKTGSGKSLFMKVLMYRLSLFGYRFASLDVQPRQGTGDGEYTGCSEFLSGINFELKSDATNCLNIFEVMETKRFVKTGIGKGWEKRTLDLNSAISQSANLIKIMISENGETDTLRENVVMNNIIVDTIKKMFASEDFRIVDGDPNSLYEFDEVAGMQVEKKLPTISDFYKVLLREQKIERDLDKQNARKIILLAMEDYVRDLFYAPESLTFFTEEEYDDMEINENGMAFFINKDGEKEEVRHIHGTRGYFDGQSSLHYSTDIPWVNIDCSQLDESAKKVAMSVGINWINERIIKGNSESRDASSKVITIFDEAHMVFDIPSARKLLDMTVATARKRNVSCFICTQTLRSIVENYVETKNMFANAASKFVFKQDYSDRQLLIDTLGLTPAEVDSIIQQGGDLDRVGGVEDDELLKAEAAKHRGEVTLVINRTAVPIKIDYRKKTEKFIAETAASEIIEEVTNSKVS